MYCLLYFSGLMIADSVTAHLNLEVGIHQLEQALKIYQQRMYGLCFAVAMQNADLVICFQNIENWFKTIFFTECCQKFKQLVVHGYDNSFANHADVGNDLHQAILLFSLTIQTCPVLINDGQRLSAESLQDAGCNRLVNTFYA
jgi:hypothetical protein